MPQNKTVVANGCAKIVIDDAALTVLPDGNGLISLSVVDGSGAVVYMHHPLSGWYIELDLRHPQAEGSVEDVSFPQLD